MTIKHRDVCIGLFLTAVITVYCGFAAAEPQLAFEPDRVVVTGVSPGGEVQWFGLVRGYDGWRKVYKRIEQVAEDEDQDGQIELLFDQVLYRIEPLFSVWAAVDLQTSEYAIAAPPDTPGRVVEITADDLILGEGGVLGLTQEHRSYLEVLLVNPGSGAWGLSVGDAGSADSDGAGNGDIQVDFSAMYPLEGSPLYPEAPVSGGVLLIIDPQRMEIGATLLTSGQSYRSVAPLGEGV